MYQNKSNVTFVLVQVSSRHVDFPILSQILSKEFQELFAIFTKLYKKFSHITQNESWIITPRGALNNTLPALDQQLLINKWTNQLPNKFLY